MYRWVNKAELPSFLKFLLKVVLTLSCVYMLGYLLYKMLDSTRGLIHWLTDKHHFWVFMACIIITLITAFILAEFYLGLEPWEKFVSFVLRKIQEFRDLIARFIKGESI